MQIKKITFFSRVLFLMLPAFLSVHQLSAINYYWIGGTSGSWTTSSNWSTSSGGSPAAFYPMANDAPIFDNGLNVEVLFNITGTSNILGFSNFKVINNTQLTLTNTINVPKNTFYINSGSSSYFEIVETGSSLSLKSNTNTNFCFGADGLFGGPRYLFNGDVRCILQPAFNTNLGPTLCSIQDSIIINRVFYIGPALSQTGINPTGNKFRFGPNGVYHIDKDGGVYLYAKWEKGSLIKITGTVNSFPSYWNSFTSPGFQYGGWKSIPPMPTHQQLPR